MGRVGVYQLWGKKRCTEEKIVKILKEVESSGKLTEACRRYGVSDVTIY